MEVSVKGKRKVKAYFTVEAALILPMALGVIVLIMYLWFFQYDRCLMEQDAGILALRGTIVEAEDNQKRVAMITKEAEQMNQDKYMAWENAEVAVIVKQGKLQVKTGGTLRFPFQARAFGMDKNIWETGVSYENRILRPTSVIRYYQKLMGGK